MIITQTPLRVSLFGGGTDFREFFSEEEGAVLSLAIDKYVYVIVKERYDEKIYVNYSIKEIVDSVGELKHELVREAMRRTWIERGVEITTLADVPSEGSGLGSSSSILVGLLNAFYAYQGQQVELGRLAQEACEIEIDTLGKPIGVQDQYIAAYGDIRFFEFQKDGTVRAEQLCMVDAQKRRLVSNLLLFYTNKTRQASTILSEQKRNIALRKAELRQLRDMAYQARGLVLKGEFDRMGEMLGRSWERKKKLASNITSPQIDRMYKRAVKAGALGGKISGAGAGGFLLLYCPRERQDVVREAMRQYRELPMQLSRDGSKVVFNIRRYGW